MPDQPRQIEWSGAARTQLHGILAYYVTHFSPEAAQRALGRIEAKARQLAQFPFSAPQIEGLDPSYRRARAGSYVLLYRALPDRPVVRIFAVRHGHRRPLSAAEVSALEREGE